MSVTSHRVPPPESVLAAFISDGPAVALPGGQGTAWRAGAAVFKPLDMSAAALGWQRDLLVRLDGEGEFRVSVPLASVDGSLVVDGWTAWRFELGDHRPGRWLEVIDVGRRFHEAVAGEPEPGFLRSRTDPWALADKVAWGELPVTRWAGTAPLDALIRALEPVEVQSQLVHGDLTGNVLFEDGLPPLVIDLSPYWRPPLFATAIVAVDALVFEGAHAGLIDRLLEDLDDPRKHQLPQHLLRAVIYRAVTDCVVAEAGASAVSLDAYRAAANLALQLV